jgi:hypothetical protein
MSPRKNLHAMPENTIRLALSKRLRYHKTVTLFDSSVGVDGAHD